MRIEHRRTARDMESSIWWYGFGRARRLCQNPMRPEILGRRGPTPGATTSLWSGPHRQVLQRGASRHERAAACQRPRPAGRGDAADADAQRHARDLRPGRRRVRLRRAAGPHRRPHRVRPALPPARTTGARAASRTRCGSTTRTSTSPTTYAAPRCPARARSTSSASSPRGSCRGASTPTDRCGRSTSSRGSRTAASRCSPSRTRSWSTASPPSTSGRCSSTSTTTPGSSCTRAGVPQDEPTPGRLALGAVAESVRHPRVAVTTAAQQRRGSVARVPSSRAARLGTLAGQLSNRRPGARVAVQHRALRPAPRGVRAHLPQGLPQGAPGARRHRQRRHPGHPVGRHPGVADDPRRVRRRRPPAACAGAR